MADIASLGIKITTEGVQEADQSLKSLSTTGAAVEKQAQRTGDAFAKSSKSFDSRPIREQKEALAQLLEQIDPTTKALNKLDEAERKLGQFRNKGVLGSEDFAAYSAKIDDMRKKTAAAGEGLHQFSLNSNFARLELGRLAKDVATGQWGAFERTAFTLGSATGLLGKVFSATGLAIAGAAAAGGVLISAYLEAEKRTEAFNNAISMTGNYLGQSAASLAATAEAMRGVGVSSAEAADALAKVVETGKFTGAQFGLVAEAAAAMESATGKSIDSTVREFERMRDEPVKAIVELNDKYHFLTEATYKQIKALEDQGRADDAATLAMRTYSAALTSRAREVEQNVHGMAAAWQNLKVIVNETWASMVRAMNGQQVDARLNAVQSLISTIRTNEKLLREHGASYSMQTIQQFNASTAAAKKQIDGLLSAYNNDPAIKAGKDAAALADAADKRTRAAIAFDQEHDKYLSRSAQMEKEIAAARQLGKDAGKSDLEIQQRVAEIREKYATKTGGGRRRTGDGGIEAATANAEIQALRDSLRNRLDAITNARKELDRQYHDGEINAETYYAALRTSAKDAAETQVAADNAQIASLQKRNLKGREAIVNEQNIAKLRADITKTQQDLAARQSDIDHRETEDAKKKQDAIDRYALALSKQNAVLQAEWRVRVESVGLGAREAQMRQDVARATQFQADELEKLNEQLQRGVGNGGINQDTYDKETRALRRATEERVQIIKDGYAQMDRAQGQWQLGARSAMADYIESARDVAGMTKNAFSNAMKGAEDVIVQFVTTGKANFADFAKAVIADFVRMETRILLSKVFQYIMSMYGGGGTGGADYSSLGGNYAGAAYAANGAAYNQGVQFFANGGVVNRATAFGTAGGGLGVMGEAGPEAILPLRRGSDGKLGVAAQSGGSITINAPVTVQTEGGSKGGSQGAASDFGKTLQAEVEATCRRVIGDEQRPGGQLWRMQHA